MSRPLVVLLRRQQEDDPYRAALDEAGFDVAFEPVLDFRFVNQDVLRSRLADAGSYSGIVVTSPRVVRALEVADCSDSLGDVPVYTVGPATAAELRSLGLSLRWEGATRAEELAEAIVEDAPQGPLLFLCGDHRREVLPARLREAGIRFDELVVYRTRRVPPRAIPEGAAWVVFFSPSGVEAASQAASFPWNRIRKAAIGPTTAEALERRGHLPAAVASEPSPAGLAAALGDP